ncbi:MAG TPA: serine/threonine protein phosphatase, partial [Cyanobacteria bacterium UBA8553]|nr:serine/threonine protein phosphatase [Cyanobacteria bacterium UBA8553]
NDLLVAGEAIRNDEDPPEFFSASIERKDELGDVIAAFRQMFKQITEAISDRKLAEAALQTSLIKVETYSKALNKELEKGREIQKNFLPAQLLQIPDWEIAAFFQPARQVAGDFYDAFKLPNDNVGLVIADVCDKGVGAALFMALFRSMLRVFSSQTQLRGRASAILDVNQPINGWIGESMSTNLAHLNALHAVCLTNDYVAEHHGDMGMFATLFFGVLDPTTGLLTYINGGHEPLFILNPEGGVKEHLKSTGPAVGMLPDMKFKICQTYLKPGEILFGYTDGVPEARNCDGEFFTAKRLLSILEQSVTSASALIDHIAESVLTHTGQAEQFDDITMLAVQRASL